MVIIIELTEPMAERVMAWRRIVVGGLNNLAALLYSLSHYLKFV